MARVLSAAATEPSVLRWLHALDPDRNLSGELLQSSVRYSTRLDASEAVAPGMPRETASLFMPMYRRSSFVLGQLYGPMSPNTLALALLSAPAPPPTPRSRRFVVDLASEKPVEFVEYEWLSDGKLCISLHEIGHAGLYEGQTLVFGGPQSPGSPVPSNLVMTLDYREAALPDRPTDVIAADWRSQPVSWETWTVAFARLRSGSSAVTTKVTIPTPPNMNHPPFTKEFQTLLREECAVGEAGFQATSANKLVRMFLQAQGMFISHPAQDEAVMRRAEQRAFTDAVTGLYEEADDEPMEFPTGDAPMLLDSGVADPASASTALVHPEVHDAARLLDEELMRNPPAPVPEFEAQPTSWNAEIASSASVSPLGTDESGDSSPGSPKAGSQAGRAAETSGTPSGASGASAPAVLDVETKPKRPAAPREHVCECGIRFLHRGHFNAHRRAVHEKIRPHICSYRNCERYVSQSPFDTPFVSRTENVF